MIKYLGNSWNGAANRHYWTSVSPRRGSNESPSKDSQSWLGIDNSIVDGCPAFALAGACFSKRSVFLDGIIFWTLNYVLRSFQTSFQDVPRNFEKTSYYIIISIIYINLSNIMGYNTFPSSDMTCSDGFESHHVFLRDFRQDMHGSLSKESVLALCHFLCQAGSGHGSNSAWACLGRGVLEGQYLI